MDVKLYTVISVAKHEVTSMYKSGERIPEIIDKGKTTGMGYTSLKKIKGIELWQFCHLCEGNFYLTLGTQGKDKMAVNSSIQEAQIKWQLLLTKLSLTSSIPILHAYILGEHVSTLPKESVCHCWRGSQTRIVRSGYTKDRHSCK